jgi:hypothetical protein
MAGDPCGDVAVDRSRGYDHKVAWRTMIYISVDNDHHGGLALSLIEKYNFSAEDVIFISHISPRNSTIPASVFRRQVIAGHPLSSGSGYKHIISYIRSISHQRYLRKVFKFSENDVLIIITEYQLNNALLARKMKCAGGQVYLFDEGIGFYFNNSAFHDLHINLIDKLFLKLYDLAFAFLGIPAYARKGFEGRMYVCIKEEYIDGVYSRMRLPIKRPLKIYGYRNFLASAQAQETKETDSVILFASNLKAFGLEREERVLMEKVVQHLAEKFIRVYIKIHPSDVVAQNENFYFYTKLIDTRSNIFLIKNSITGNEAMELYKPRIVAGVLGATMFDAFFFGCHPIFLFHFLPPVPEFRICNFILEGMGYNFVQSLECVNPKYQCHVDAGSLLYDKDIKSPWEIPSRRSKISTQN